MDKLERYRVRRPFQNASLPDQGAAARLQIFERDHPINNQGAVNRLQTTERDCALNREFEQGRAVARDQKLKSAGFSPMSSHLKKVRALIFPVAGSISHSYE